MTRPLTFRDEMTGDDAIRFELDAEGNLVITQFTPDEEMETVMYRPRWPR